MKSEKSEISFDLNKLGKYSFLLLLLIPVFMSVYFRMQPASLPMMDTLAAQNIIENVKIQIQNQILQESPNLPPNVLEKEAAERLEAELSASSAEFEQASKTLADSFRAKLQDEDGQTYLLAIDPYAYYRQTRNLLEKGHICDLVVDGKCINNHMIAPLGREEKPSLHPYFSAFLYNILHPLTGKSLMAIFFWVPVIISALAVIPAFFIGRRFAGNFGGFVSAVLVAVHSAFISRTAAGFSDTDAYNVTIPLFIAWLLIEAWLAEDIKWKMGFSSLSAFLVGVFSFAWMGWGFIFDIVMAAMGVCIAYEFLKNYKSIIKDKFRSSEFTGLIAVFLAFIAISALSVSVFSGFSDFFRGAFQTTLGFSERFESVAKTTVWPNVFTTVAEQNYAPFPEVINIMGGKLLFFLSLLGLFLYMFKEELDGKELVVLIIGAVFLLVFSLAAIDSLLFLFLLAVPFAARAAIMLVRKNYSVNLCVPLLFFVWFMATLYASRLGIRFTLLLVPAFAIGVGFCFGRLSMLLSKYMEIGLKIPRNISSVIVFLVFLLVLLFPVKAGWDTAVAEMPSMDDAWWEALTFIKENSTDDDYKDEIWNGAIINSWWDFGHWFKAVADRAVTFDGETQNTPMAHWIGHVLLTENEDEAVGLLRMLDCGSNQAFEELDSVIDNVPKSVGIIHEIVAMDKDSAINTLTGYGLTDEQAKKVVEKTHCEPPENYFITSEDMVAKAGVWAHFGSWNFTKAEMYMRVKGLDKEKGLNMLMKDYGLTAEQATQIYYDIQTEEANNWVAPWPSYAQRISCRTNQSKLNCGGLIIDLTGRTATVPKNIDLRLNQVTYMANGVLQSFTVDKKGELSVSILPGNQQALLMYPELAKSMFNILFFYNGNGLEHFDLAKHTTSLTGDEIYVWKVDWEGK